MAPPTRPTPQILAELAEVRRHLREAPPHHGEGIRDVLQQKLRQLERELVAARERPRGR